jgi:hypothetical protein
VHLAGSLGKDVGAGPRVRNGYAAPTFGPVLERSIGGTEIEQLPSAAIKFHVTAEVLPDHGAETVLSVDVAGRTILYEK